MASLEPELLEILEQVFTLSLEIRTLGIVGHQKLGTEWQPTGTIFDERCMDIQKSDALSVAPIQATPRVRLTILPGLRIVHSERALVDCHGFTYKHEASGDLLAKAVVYV